MSVDEALENADFVARDWDDDIAETLLVLAAEVRRLRALVDES